jgi:hypothetical protein
MPPPNMARAGQPGEDAGSRRSHDQLWWQINRTLSPICRNGKQVKCCADRDLPDPYPTYPEAPSAAKATVLACHSPREKDDAYPTVARLNERWRVICCCDDIQWVLQKHSGGRWRGNSFCRTRAGLLRCIKERSGRVDAAALELIRALPEWYQEGTP